jgi:flagellar biosynthetic protein FliP
VTGSGALGFAAAILVTLGLLVLVLYLLKRMQGWDGAGPGVPLRILKRVSFGPKQGVALVQVADRVLVVAIADTSMNLLAELEEPSRAQALGGSSSPPAGAGRTGLDQRFRSLLLGKLTVALLLAVLPWTARAQGTPPPAAASSTPATTVTTAAPARGAVNAPVTVTPPPRASAIAPGGLLVNGPLPPKVEIRLGEGRNALELSGTVGLVVLMGVLTLLPAIFLLMTSFTRILIVLHFLRSALGTQTAPPNQLLVAFAVLLTGVVMNPVLQKTNRSALQPYFNGQLTQVEAYGKAVQPFREFMLANTRGKELAMFTELSGSADAKSIDEVPTLTVISAFVTSELRTAFQMGFVIFLPFVVLDVIVASVLMSLGMFMLPPPMVSLPFKLLLFVLADGWDLVVQNLVASFH